MTGKVSAAEITLRLRNALALRYPEPEWLLWEEMSLDGVGRVDAIAVNAYRSSGHVVHGFEIKASRADWRRELKTMRKSNGAFGYCHRWWLVTVPGVVEPIELPPEWGLLFLRNSDGIDQLRKVRDAAPLTPLKHLDTTHYIAMARRTRRAEVTDMERVVELRREYDRGYKAGERNAKAERSAAAERDERGLRLVRQLERMLDGYFGLSEHSLTRLEPAIRWALRHEGRFEKHVEWARNNATRFLAETEWAVGASIPEEEPEDRDGV